MAGRKMKPDSEKSKGELIQELQEFRRRATEADTLLRRLETLENQRNEFKSKRHDQSRPESGEFSQRDQTTEALRMAQLIIDKSPVILFRRLAGADPRLIYVSENISRFGYSADRFLSGQIVFKNIVHPDDSERTIAEIKEYARENVEEYTQFYRIVTSDGDIRWVEDQTTVVRDAAGNKRFNQGIVIDITERRLAEEELRKSEEKFRRIVETTGEGFLMMDDDLKISSDWDCHWESTRASDTLTMKSRTYPPAQSSRWEPTGSGRPAMPGAMRLARKDSAKLFGRLQRKTRLLSYRMSSMR
jgi:sigma-B regulation protein RsbU (phosphoserine phosphatase)